MGIVLRSKMQPKPPHRYAQTHFYVNGQSHRFDFAFFPFPPLDAAGFIAAWPWSLMCWNRRVFDGKEALHVAQVCVFAASSASDAAAAAAFFAFFCFALPNFGWVGPVVVSPSSSSTAVLGVVVLVSAVSSVLEPTLGVVPKLVSPSRARMASG